MKNILLALIIFFTTYQTYAGFGDWIEKTANRFVGLDTSIAEISELSYSYSDFNKYFGGSKTLQDVTGKLTNNSNKDTIKTVVFKYEILECTTTDNCITIDEDEEKWSTNIPPGQSRYFDHSLAYKKGNSTKDIYFRQTIKYLYPYSDM